MSWQDRDLKRLKIFMEKRGITLARRSYNRSTGVAEYDDSKKQITLFPSNNAPKNKTEIILTLLHELAHHLDEKKYSNDKRMEEAFLKLNEGRMCGKRPDLNKEDRRKILQFEKAGLKHWIKLKKTLDLEIPLKKIEKQQKIDIFHYQGLYDTGAWPTTEETKVYKRSLK